jgi:hypothetical protein
MKSITFLLSILFFTSTNVFPQGGVMKIWPSGDISIGSQSIGGPGINIQPCGHTYLVTSLGGPWVHYNMVYSNHQYGLANIVWYNYEFTSYARADGWLYAKQGCHNYADIEGMDDIQGIQNPLEMVNNIHGITFQANELLSMSKLSDDSLQAGLGKLNNSKSDTSEFISKLYQESKMKHYGIIAQELQKVMPEAVKQINETQLGVVYDYLVPLLIEAVKELNSKVEYLSKVQYKSASFNDIITESNNLPTSKLFQNNPNPFSEKTVIKFDLGSEIKSAMVLLFDMQGGLVMSFPDLRQNCCSVTVDAQKLKPGIYYYSLIADDKEIDTKKLIITK